MTDRQAMRRSTVTWFTEAKVHLSLKINPWRVLTHLLYPNGMFHGRCKRSIAVLSSTAAFLSLFKKEPGKEKLCCGLTFRNSVSFWKSLILRPPGWRWLEPSGFSSVLSSRCLSRNQERILPKKLWVLCKSIVKFWSKLLDRQKINVKCWEPQWLGAVLQISCRWTSMLFSSFQPRVQRAIPVAFVPYTSLPHARLHTVDVEHLLHPAAIMRSLKPASTTLSSHACLLNHICILVSRPISEHKGRSISVHLSLD